MCLDKPLFTEDDDSYDLACLNTDDAPGLITLYVELDLASPNWSTKSKLTCHKGDLNFPS